MSKIVMITGASSGIGKATALLLAQNGYSVIITGRRRKLLSEIENEIRKYSNSLILCFDVSKQEEVKAAFDKLPPEWQNIDCLINNAGLAAGLSPLQTADMDDFEQMIDTNIKGLLYVTKKVMPIMINRNSGHIINIASIAGKEVYSNGGVYCATKHAVEALSKSMRIDLLPHGIKVTNISPGMVDTEFSLVRFKGDKAKADNVYKGLTPLYANDVAEAILFAISRPPHVNINDMLIMPTAQANSTNVIRNE